MSTTLSSVAYGELKNQILSSILEVNFVPESNQVAKAKQSYVRDSYSKNFAAENVVEIGGRIIVSF